MRGVTSPSATGPAIVATWGMRCGAALAQGSVPWTFYPTQHVVCFLAERASTSYGALIQSPDGGMPSCSVRQCTWPAAREHCCTHTRCTVATAGTAAAIREVLRRTPVGTPLSY